MTPYVTGNAEEDGLKNIPKGWFVGHFIDPALGLRCTEALEIKWGVHRKNEERATLSDNKIGMTLTILVSGSFVIYFPEHDRTIELKHQGDYVLFAPKVAHSWKVIEDSVVLTVRWPSKLNDKN